MTCGGSFSDTRNRPDAVQNHCVKASDLLAGSISDAVGKEMEGDQVLRLKTQIGFLHLPKAADEKAGAGKKYHG